MDAVVIGSGPNGLAAAIALAQKGLEVEVLEAADTVGGGTRTSQLTLPGFRHDVCSGVHPMGVNSPFFRSLPLESHGLEWLGSAVSVAHPLDGEPAITLVTSVEDTARGLGDDEEAYRAMLAPFLGDPQGLLTDALAPLGLPKNPWMMLRFGLKGMHSANDFLYQTFAGRRARALFAGCAGHGVLPFDRSFTAAFGLVFLLTAHMRPWPVAKGGSQAIANALAAVFEACGGHIRTGVRVERLEQLEDARAILFDTSPDQVVSIAGDALPASYRARLERFRYGPGVFKIDWALDGPIPWTDANCSTASTVHIGGTAEEVAAAEAAVAKGDHPERPFILLCQQSVLDPTRAPPGQHTGYAYCHVPNGSTRDRTDAIESQVERFAPGFRDRILARHVMHAADFEAYNPNYVGGAITGGAADVFQLFTRPVARLDPYRTPNPRIFICSASTPPGGGVHGMCGYHAAQSVLRSLGVK